MAHPTWPLYDVVIRTPTIEVRLPSEDEYVQLLAHADETIHARTGIYPFLSDWVGKPAESMQYMWRSKAEWKPQKWHFPLSVFVDGEIVGTQAIEATDFAVVRAVSTGSWLKAAAQGQGIGKEMRTAVLHFAFAGLGALEAHSEAHVDNAASNAVSRALGYEFTHRTGASFRGERAEQWQMILRRDTWRRIRRTSVPTSPSMASTRAATGSTRPPKRGPSCRPSRGVQRCAGNAPSPR